MFGINIGNTNASIAFCKENGRVQLITNESGDRLTPALVTIMDKDISVGVTDKIITNATATITSNKSVMSKTTLNQTPISCNNSISIQIQDMEINYCVHLEENLHYFTPQNIVMFIFQELLITAKSALSVENCRLPCVLLVPRSFSNDYCEKYKLAAEEAGWKVLQIINEAAAAVLAYSLLESKDDMLENVIIYRLGGTTCEITACEISHGVMTTLDSTYREDIGGNLFVDVLANFLSNEFYRKYKLDPREKRRSFEKLKQASQNCIHVLSNLPMSNCLIESLHEGIDFSINLSRARFETLIKPLLERCIEPLQIFIDNLKLNRPIDKVVLCGGVTNIPSLKRGILTIVNKDETEILTHINPEEVLAIGGAKQAYYLNNSNCHNFLPRTMDIILETEFVTNDKCF